MQVFLYCIRYLDKNAFKEKGTTFVAPLLALTIEIDGHLTAARQVNAVLSSLTPDVIAKRTKRHLDELEVHGSQIVHCASLQLFLSAQIMQNHPFHFWETTTTTNQGAVNTLKVEPGLSSLTSEELAQRKRNPQ
jgi:hypothetical protein